MTWAGHVLSLVLATLSSDIGPEEEMSVLLKLQLCKRHLSFSPLCPVSPMDHRWVPDPLLEDAGFLLFWLSDYQFETRIK